MSHSQTVQHTAPATLPESMESMNWDLISSYSRREAIDDGVLVDVTQSATEAGFKVPVALTSAAWSDCVEWTDADNSQMAFQDQPGRLWDVLWMALNATRRPGAGDRVTFIVHRVPRDGSSVAPLPVTLVMHIGPGDTAAPVITIGFSRDF